MFRLLLLLFLVGCSKPPEVVVAPVVPNQEAEQLLSVEPLFAAPVPPPAQEWDYRGYNLIFVSFDALQASHVHHLGCERPTTPTIDTFARKGITFEKFYSVSAWTVPSSMTWFTGVYPSEHRMTNKFAIYSPTMQKIAKLKELAPEMVTLADLFKLNGYATGGFTGNAGVSGGFGYDQGFDRYYFEPGKFGSFHQSVPLALQWVKENRDRRFFLFLHGYDIHGQSTPPSGFDYRFVPPGYDGRYAGSGQEQEFLREEGLARGQLTLRDEDVQFWRAVYDEKIQRADAQFSRFIHEIAKLGLLQKTIFVLTSDHGTEFYEHRRFDHGFTLYNEQIQVPFVLYLPGGTASRIRDRHSSIDLMPTLIDLLQLETPDPARRQLHGESLLPVLRGEKRAKNLFSETNYREYTFKRSIISPDGWKLIYTLESKTRELFDLNTDPREQVNLAEKQPDRAKQLQEALFSHFKKIGHDLTLHAWEPGMNPVYPSQGKEKR
jgi:arylsulfatase A-like enzyme